MTSRALIYSYGSQHWLVLVLAQVLHCYLLKPMMLKEVKVSKAHFLSSLSIDKKVKTNYQTILRGQGLAALSTVLKQSED